MNLPTAFSDLSNDEKYKFLNHYFSGKKATLTEDFNGVVVSLDWFDDVHFYVDDQLSGNLSILGDDLNTYGIPNFRKACKGYNLVLNDNWTLYNWTKILREKQKDIKENNRPLVIIHIDDHFDCMPPTVFLKNTCDFIDPITGLEVSINNPESCASAIQSGAIAIGSFITPFLHHTDSFNFRYLISESRKYKGPFLGSVKKGVLADSLFEASFRPTLEFQEERSNNNSFIISTEIDEIVSGIPDNAVILVHIDMDYFNNRFDGDTDWMHHTRKHDPVSDVVFHNISLVLSTLKNKLKQEQIIDFTIAFSPGFFPSEYWKESLRIFKKYLGNNEA